MSGTTADGRSGTDGEPKRRDFLYITATAFAGVGGLMALWPFIDQMNPSANVLALASTDVDLTKVAEGQQITISWRGKPVFVRHRTEADIEAARDTPLAALPDPELDQDRVQRPEWLVMIGICTHLGCIPLADQGDYHGWFCPCHGSHYDTSGRIRRGPAPTNMEVPPYVFLDDTQIRIG